MNKLGRAIKAARNKRGLTLREFERLSKDKISNSYLSQIESGHKITIHPSKMKIISTILKIDLMKLYKLAGYV